MNNPLQLYRTKFKTLVVSGCSFTHNNHESDCVWANLLATWLGLDIVNLATPGAGNDHIANSLIMYLDQHKPNPAETLVIPMWSSINRSDFLVDSAKHSTDKGFSYNSYTNHYRVGGEWIAEVAAEEFKKLQSPTTLALKSWLDFINLTNYLKQNNYEYRYLTFMDILHSTKNTINFFNELKKLNLQLDLTNWLLTKDKHTLGDFCIFYDLTCYNDIHPNLEGQEQWTKQVLIPELVKEGLCYE